MTSLVLVFSGPDTANHLVAGVPAAARAAREIALASCDPKAVTHCVIAVPGGWTPSARCDAELRRLAPDLAWTIADTRQMGLLPDTLYLRGEALPPARDIVAAVIDPVAQPRSIGRNLSDLANGSDGGVRAKPLADLDRASAAILRATGKPSDGIVSRTINRPISRAISRVLLRIPGITPFHATLGTMALGIAMAASLFLGGGTGLIWGAILFQAASIFDGVDGEIARATFRTSAAGAMLDSVTDAATNLAFIAGLAINLWMRGQDTAAAAGAIGLAMLAIGLFLIGQRARAKGGPFTFDAVKNHFRATPSRLMQVLTWITMRDFFAAAGAVAILLGFAPQALITFAIAATGWLAVTVSVLLRARLRPI